MDGNLSSTSIALDIELKPSYVLSLSLVISSLLLLLFSPWIGLILGIFGLFLVIQTTLIRLRFTESSLEVYRQNKLIRSFPYDEWENWQIFWQPVPILFYFKEVKSIHFLPVLFDPNMLQSCLEQCVPKH
jgi:hypothetical protein